MGLNNIGIMDLAVAPLSGEAVANFVLKFIIEKIKQYGP
jgi:hypothetical protein